MNKVCTMGILLSLLLASAQTQQSSVTATGFLTDTQCGARGATAQHIDCAKRKVAMGKAMYAVYDEATKRLYILEPQATAEQYLGHRVKVTGTVSYSPLTRAGQSIVYPEPGPGNAATAQVVPHTGALDSSTVLAANTSQDS